MYSDGNDTIMEYEVSKVTAKFPLSWSEKAAPICQRAIGLSDGLALRTLIKARQLLLNNQHSQVSFIRKAKRGEKCGYSLWDHLFDLRFDIAVHCFCCID